MLYTAGAAGAGSPAWAGIDLGLAALGAYGLGFPRVGGDRPSLFRTQSIGYEVPPRGRG